MYYDEKLAHEVQLPPKENYLRLLRGQDFEWLPTFFNAGNAWWTEELLSPMLAPDGPIVTTLGVTYVGNPENNFGALPDHRKLVITDISKWRDQLKIKDLSDFDFADYYAKKLEPINREINYVSVGGADYFLTLVSLMGFEETIINMYEEPDEIKELLEVIHEFYMMIYKKQLQYMQPDILMTMDDICGKDSPFITLEQYREFFKPLEKDHYDLALERDIPISHHCCGKCEIFIDDWMEIGVTTWNPAQTTNDLVGIKKRLGDKLTIEGGWDTQVWEGCLDEEKLRAAVYEYIDTFAPGQHFVFNGLGGDFPDKDPDAAWRQKIIDEIYFSYGFDYYKNH